MNGFFIKWLVSTAALWCADWIIPGISIDRFETLILASLILSLLNTFIRPLITLLTLPLQVLSLGIFTLIVNGFMFLLASKMVAGFFVADFASAFWGALLFSIVSFILNLSVAPSGKFNFFYQENRSHPSAGSGKIIDVEGHEVDGRGNKKIGGS